MRGTKLWNRKDRRRVIDSCNISVHPGYLSKINFVLNYSISVGYMK